MCNRTEWAESFAVFPKFDKADAGAADRRQSAGEVQPQDAVGARSVRAPVGGGTAGAGVDRAIGAVEGDTLLRDRFGLEATIEKPATLYKETLREPAEGFVEYTLPKPCWAVLRFLLEPGERGSGVIYRSRVSTDRVKLKYQREVERALPLALEQGLLGWEVTDLRITLLEGEDHEVHSRPTDFAIATPMGIFDALQRGGTRLLEPVLRFSLSAPEEAAGSVLGDLLRMRGSFDAPRVEDGTFRVEGTLPADTCGDYAIRLGSLTGGRGRFATRFGGYRDCPEEIRAEAPRRGVSPLDRARYILAARGALG